MNHKKSTKNMTPAELSTFLQGKPDNAAATTATGNLFSRQEDTENE